MMLKATFLVVILAVALSQSEAGPSWRDVLNAAREAARKVKCVNRQINWGQALTPAGQCAVENLKDAVRTAIEYNSCGSVCNKYKVCVAAEELFQNCEADIDDAAIAILKAFGECFGSLDVDDYVDALQNNNIDLNCGRFDSNCEACK